MKATDKAQKQVNHKWFLPKESKTVEAPTYAEAVAKSKTQPIKEEDKGDGN
jgi:hypothetical protein